MNAEMPGCSWCQEKEADKSLTLNRAFILLLLWVSGHQDRGNTIQRRECEMPFSEHGTANGPHKSHGGLQ